MRGRGPRIAVRNK